MDVKGNVLEISRVGFETESIIMDVKGIKRLLLEGGCYGFVLMASVFGGCSGWLGSIC